jgi:hypothetical protein
MRNERAVMLDVDAGRQSVRCTHAKLRVVGEQ